MRVALQYIEYTHKYVGGANPKRLELRASYAAPVNRALTFTKLFVRRLAAVRLGGNRSSSRRERREDIAVYAQAFLARNATNRRLTLDGDAIKILMSYTWPGNVRELQNAVERLLASFQSDIVRAADVVSVLDAPSDATESAGTVDYDPRKSRSWAP